MLQRNVHNHYWEAFAQYQTFDDVKAMFETVKQFVKTYSLTSTMKAVLNTIKLHAKNYVGVCWLFREEIAKRAKVSLPSVDRAVKALKEVGLLTVHNFIHTKRGGKTHNIYIINPVDNLVEDVSPDDTFDDTFEASNDSSEMANEKTSTPCGSKVEVLVDNSYKNAHTNPNNNLNNNLNITSFDKVDKELILRHVPVEFQDIMNPYYGHQPQIILNRWKTVCVAIKKSCFTFENTSWDTIAYAWKIVNNRYKRKLIHNTSDDGLGAYFYSILCDLLVNEYVQNLMDQEKSTVQ